MPGLFHNIYLLHKFFSSYLPPISLEMYEVQTNILIIQAECRIESGKNLLSGSVGTSFPEFSYPRSALYSDSARLSKRRYENRPFLVLYPRSGVDCRVCCMAWGARWGLGRDARSGRAWREGHEWKMHDGTEGVTGEGGDVGVKIISVPNWKTAGKAVVENAGIKFWTGFVTLWNCVI